MSSIDPDLLGTQHEIVSGINPLFPGHEFGQEPITIDFVAGDFINPSPLTDTVLVDGFCQLVLFHSSIPTLSEWGAIILGTLLLLLTVFSYWRRRSPAPVSL
jgi:hypothetical protein